MLDFNCERCYEEIIDENGEQVTECEHYPTDQLEMHRFKAEDFFTDLEDNFVEHYEE